MGPRRCFFVDIPAPLNKHPLLFRSVVSPPPYSLRGDFREGCEASKGAEAEKKAENTYSDDNGKGAGPRWERRRAPVLLIPWFPRA